MNPQHSHVEVAGDVVTDVMITVASRADSLDWAWEWELDRHSCVCTCDGGAALLAALLSEMVTADVVTSGATHSETVHEGLGSAASSESLSVWGLCESAPGSRTKVWRMREFLGRNSRGSDADKVARPTSGPALPVVAVFDDANLGYREDETCWPGWLTVGDGLPDHVVVKMTNPLGQGELWNRLAARQPASLIMYLAVDDLRKHHAGVSRMVSWEQITSDIDAAVRSETWLSHASAVVVSLGPAGAVIVNRPEDSTTLVYDPSGQESDWAQTRPGFTPGCGTAITAALAAECVNAPSGPDLGGAVKAGLRAYRAVHETGYLVAGGPDSSDLEFPFQVAVEAANDPSDDPFEVCSVRPGKEWTVLTTVLPGDLTAVSKRIVTDGVEAACAGVPVERVGRWASLDHREIEAMRSIRNTITEFVSAVDRPIRPLSLAVFGPPGCGKSFAIKQLAGDLPAADPPLRVLEFNVSQMSSDDELHAAFDLIRDSAVQGRLAFVFWDEFDTPADGQPLYWLKRFLAPMQDGSYHLDGHESPIGPAVFVFAGGTHSSMAQFRDTALAHPETKAPDFASRLRGSLDVLGPNRADDADEMFVLRRALLFRALLEQRRLVGEHAAATASIDPGVLNAVLGVSRYVHGARSLEALIDMSSLTGTGRFVRAALPPRDQLAGHVDPDDFLALVESEGHHDDP